MKLQNMKLAVVGIVSSVTPIAGADRIQQVHVHCGDAGDWSAVASVDIEPRDRVTVFLQDALLPAHERWAFMERHKWRVRMARFKGVPSECVIVAGAPPMLAGTDLTEALGVTKYYKPLPDSLSGDAIGPFPSFIHKTDEANFQAVPETVARMDGAYWVATEKCDGSSCTVWNDEDGQMHVASRNLELTETNAKGAGNSYWRTARQYDMRQLPPGCALQYEVVGPGVQGNPMGLDKVEGRAFTLYDYRAHQRRDFSDLLTVCAAIGIPLARPVCSGLGSLNADQLRKMAETTYPSGNPVEGIVIRPFSGDWSFKVLNLHYKD